MVLKKILVAIDLNETSTRLLEFGRMVADACGASLHVLTVIGYPVGNPHAIEQEKRDACRRLDALLATSDRATRRFTTCEVGTPAHEIVQYAADHGIDLIVMGTHSHGPAFHLAFGSNAESVLRLAPCAVLAVKDAAAPRAAAVERIPATTTAQEW